LFAGFSRSKGHPAPPRIEPRADPQPAHERRDREAPHSSRGAARDRTAAVTWPAA
jgi:hypothetical protein